MPVSTVAVLSFRLGEVDGVSIEAAKWVCAFERLGYTVTTVAGEGIADHIIPGLEMGADEPPDAPAIESALAGVDLVVVENLCSLPLNRPAADVVAKVLAGRPAILHHHDLPWQRPVHSLVADFPPDDEAWCHVTINDLSRRQLAERQVMATAISNCFDVDVVLGDRENGRAAAGAGPDERLLVHPTRAIPRKNVPAALGLAEGIGATYWLLGPAEDGYGAELAKLLSNAPVRVIQGLPSGLTIADAYAAADAVTLPSTWEGFGNATIESAVHRRPLAIGSYPVAAEIAAHGFRWFPADDPSSLAGWLDDPDVAVIDGNEAIARKDFSLDTLDRRLAELLQGRGWSAG